MFAPFALTLALLAPSAPVPKDVPPQGPAPLIVDLKPNPDGKVLVTVRREEKRKVAVRGPAINPNAPDGAETREITSIRTLQVELTDVKDLQVFTAGGKAVETKDALAKIKEGAVVIRTTDGKKVDPNFLRVFKDDTLVLVSPEFTGTALRTTGGFGTLPVRPLPPIKIQPAVVPPPQPGKD
jgi:hypothetical protein